MNKYLSDPMNLLYTMIIILATAFIFTEYVYIGFININLIKTKKI